MVNKIYFEINYSFGEEYDKKSLVLPIKIGEIEIDFLFGYHFFITHIYENSIKVEILTHIGKEKRTVKTVLLKPGEVGFFETPTIDAGAYYMFYIK